MKVKIKEYSTLLMHILAWAVIFMLPFIFTAESYDETEAVVHYKSDFYLLNTVTKIFWVLTFYLNSEILIPRFIYKKKYIQFTLFQACIFSIIMLMHGLLFNWIVVGEHNFHFFRSSSYNIISFLFTVIASLAYKTISDKSKSEAEAHEKQRENLKTELSFLRSQISPHFLFNVLNNMVALVRLKSDDLEPTILKLSSLMQYMLYETDEEKVLLQSEVGYLQSYIDLQKQRFGKKLTLNVAFNVAENWHSIEPMLLIPFVENAFKHGIGLVQNPVIDICLKADNNELNFSVKNKYIRTDDIKDKTSGIGLANVKRRLALLYADNQQLTIDDVQGWFAVSLKLTFKS